MDTRKQLETLIDRSFKLQKSLFYGVGIVSGLTGVVILILTFTMPVQPGEEQIVQILQMVSIIFVIFAVGFPLFIRNRLTRVKSIIFETSERIAEVKAFTVTRRGVPGFAVRIIMKDKKMLGFNVAGPKMQNAIVTLIKQHIHLK